MIIDYEWDLFSTKVGCVCLCMVVETSLSFNLFSCMLFSFLSLPALFFLLYLVTKSGLFSFSLLLIQFHFLFFFVMFLSFKLKFIYLFVSFVILTCFLFFIWSLFLFCLISSCLFNNCFIQFLILFFFMIFSFKLFTRFFFRIRFSLFTFLLWWRQPDKPFFVFLLPSPASFR